MMQKKNWIESHRYTPERLDTARQALEDIRAGKDVMKAIRDHPLPSGGHIGKHTLVAAYRNLVEDGHLQPDLDLLARIRMKPVRSLSGVTTVTVLTEPHTCPGRCIFCPDDARMPKSYLPDEPAAARAFENQFDPFVQVQARLGSLQAVGHPVDKIELLVLGGSWNAYSRDYQEWFIRRCFDALNGADSDTLASAHNKNEEADSRCVGLSIETRPDEVKPELLAWLRRLGVTKVQMGAQSLNDDILARNCRGHTAADTLQACALLRAAGFKIVLHWMPNLLGATIELDRTDFVRLWDGGFCPDELKIYPTQLLAETVLHDHWQRGEYTPYTTDELVQLIADIKPGVPPYCRINRVIRDIPSHHVVAGNRRTSLRQDIHVELQRRGQSCGCIRCREVRGQAVVMGSLQLQDHIYYPAYAEEHFLSFVTPDDHLAGYLRLSLPSSNAPATAMDDLVGAAIIREVHVYGQALPVGEEQSGAAQHAGAGSALLEEAGRIAHQAGFNRMAVIAAVGTRRYYAGRGFEPGELYMIRSLHGTG